MQPVANKKWSPEAPLETRYRKARQEWDNRMGSAIVQAKKTADDARKLAAKLSLWLAASLLAGALASILAATEGGLLRDSEWHQPGWRPGPFGTERSPH